MASLKSRNRVVIGTAGAVAITALVVWLLTRNDDAPVSGAIAPALVAPVETDATDFSEVVCAKTRTYLRETIEGLETEDKRGGLERLRAGIRGLRNDIERVPDGGTETYKGELVRLLDAALGGQNGAFSEFAWRATQRCAE